MNYTRRGLILLAAGAVTGCAIKTLPDPEPTKSSPARQSELTQSLLPSPTKSSTPTTGSPFDRNQIIAQHRERQPLEWGLTVTGVVTRTDLPTVALTFDGCGGNGGSGVDDNLLTHLIDTNIKATLFLNYRWIQANRALVDRLAANPLFQIGNHGYHHLPLSVTGRSAYGIAGTKSVAEAIDEVWKNHEYLTSILGQPPLFFRSGTAHYDEVAVEIVRQIGEVPVNFSINGDAGATANSSTIVRTVSQASPGDIVIGHLNRPKSQTADGFTKATIKMLANRIIFGHLTGPN